MPTYSTGQAPRGPSPPPFDTKTSASNPWRLPDNPHAPVGCQPTAPNKPPTWPKPLPFDTKTSVSNPCRLPTYREKPHVAQNPHPLTPRLQFLIPVGCQPQHQTNPNPHPLIPRLQCLQVANIKHQTSPTWPKPAPFDTNSTYGTVQAAQAPRGPNPHHFIPRLQFQIPVGSQPTAPAKPHVAQTPPFDTKTSVSNPCKLPTYSDKPHVAQNLHHLIPRLQILIPIRCQPRAPTRQAPRGPNRHHLTPRLIQFLILVGSQPTAPDKPHVAQTQSFDTKTSVSNPCI